MRRKHRHGKTKKTFLTLVLLIAAYLLQAQPTIQWQHNFGGSYEDQSWSMVQTRDGGSLVSGFSTSVDDEVMGPRNKISYWLLKVDSLGNIQWKKSYPDPSDNYLYSIQGTKDGGYILAGAVNSDTGQQTGNLDYRITKIDSMGNVQWKKTYGGSSSDVANCIVQTFDGGYIVNGYTESSDGNIIDNHGSFDYWVLKLDSIGNIQWQRCLGGSKIDWGTCIVQSNDGGYLAGGYSESSDGNSTGGYACYNYWIVKLDSAGTVLWQKSYGGNSYDYLNFLKQTTDGGYILAGSTFSTDGDVTHNKGNQDYWIVKVDSQGMMQWQTTLGGTGFDVALTITQTGDGGYLAAGTSNSDSGQVTGNHGGYDCWIAKLDSAGNFMWGQSLGGTDAEEVHSIYQTTDGGYVFSGFSSSDDGDLTGSFGGQDYWVVKLACPRTYANEFFVDTLSFLDTNVSIDTLVSVSVENNQLSDSMSETINTTDSLFVLSHLQITTIVHDSAFVSINGCDNTQTRVSDYFDTIVDTVKVSTKYLSQTRDTLYKLINYIQTDVPDLSAPHISIYPNPFTAVITVDIGDRLGSIIMTDALGRIVLTADCYGKIELTPHVSSSGMYFVAVTIDGVTSVTKVVTATN